MRQENALEISFSDMTTFIENFCNIVNVNSYKMDV